MLEESTLTNLAPKGTCELVDQARVELTGPVEGMLGVSLAKPRAVRARSMVVSCPNLVDEGGSQMWSACDDASSCWNATKTHSMYISVAFPVELVSRSSRVLTYRDPRTGPRL